MCGLKGFARSTNSRTMFYISVFGSGRVGSGRVGSGRVGSGRVGSGRVGSGRVGSGRVGSGQKGFKFHWSGRITLIRSDEARRDPTREDPWCTRQFVFQPEARRFSFFCLVFLADARMGETGGVDLCFLFGITLLEVELKCGLKSFARSTNS